MSCATFKLDGLFCRGALSAAGNPHASINRNIGSTPRETRFLPQGKKLEKWVGIYFLLFFSSLEKKQKVAKKINTLYISVNTRLKR